MIAVDLAADATKRPADRLANFHVDVADQQSVPVPIDFILARHYCEHIQRLLHDRQFGMLRLWCIESGR